MNNRNYSQPDTLISHRKRNSTWPVILGCLGILGMVFVVIALGGYFYLTANAASQSVVFIRSPQDGEQIEAGQPIQVRALARDDHKVVRIELWVDGKLLATESSAVTKGISPFPLLTTWYPQAGAHTLIVRSFNSRGGTSQASVNVEAVTLADRDGDKVADEADACPDQPGNPAAGGCTDRDFDGVADTRDACPTEAGLPADGCPVPSETDRDGDGMFDDVDACPDEAGSLLADGCRDTDGDGVGDGSDACMTEPGGGADGCPTAGDLDGDGVLDGEDACPIEPGLPENSGCPDGGGDDGAPEPLPGSDPPDPTDDDNPEEGPVFGDMGFELDPPIHLEIEALTMSVGRRYESIWCYVRLDEGDVRRYEFETLDELHWNAAEVLGGDNSLRLLHSATNPLRIRVDCFGSDPGGSGALADSGTIIVEHPPQEWDGRELMLLIPEADDTLVIAYRICSPSCDEEALQIPDLYPVTTGPFGVPPYTLSWRWNGDSSQISGFGLSVFSENEAASFAITNPEMRSLNIADYRPACGETVYFQMYAWAAGATSEIRSPLSNVQAWNGKPCTYTAKITFEYIETELDYIGGDYDGRGPIYGTFYAASGSETQTLRFDGGRCWSFLWIFSCNGYAISVGRYNIASMFNAMDAEDDGYAPDSNYLIVEFDPGEDLSFGGSIWDEEAYGNDERLFNARGSIGTNETFPAEITLRDETEYGWLNLTVRIEKISGP